eukprot:TRINITY_DN3378_c0_g1_i1.p1 TRINITY_DN3378_c0_g1~~TRINITY_DN3378_c0_g1_i1.p1  ORF type:complete len:166 (+),score=23.41 TRINITY_DN3378_c0_g1_i1:86-583(+)
MAYQLSLKSVSSSSFELLFAEILRYSRNVFPEHEQSKQLVKSIGQRTGRPIFEVHTATTARFKNELDMVKLVCKEVWTKIYLKGIDNLRTNHNGVYVLTDNVFMALQGLHADVCSNDDIELIMAFHEGILEGGFVALGYTASVSADTSALPACKQQHAQCSHPPQ